jgi:hypothetical protein
MARRFQKSKNAIVLLKSVGKITSEVEVRIIRFSIEMSMTLCYWPYCLPIYKYLPGENRKLDGFVIVFHVWSSQNSNRTLLFAVVMTLQIQRCKRGIQSQ